MISAPYLLFSSLVAAHIGTLNGLQAFDQAGVLVAIDGVVSTILIVSAANVAGLTGAGAAMPVAAALAAIAGSGMMASECRARGIAICRRGVGAELSLLRQLVLPTFLIALSARSFAWAGRFLLARDGLMALGIFSAAHSWGSGILAVPAQIARPSMPILTGLLSGGQQSEYRRLFRHTLMLATVSTAIVAIPIMVLSPWMMRAYGPSFRSGALVLVIVAAASLVGGISGAMRAALVAAGRVWNQSAHSLLWGLTLIVTFLVLRDRGEVGLAAAHLAAWLVAFIAQAFVVVRMGTAAAVPATSTAAVGADLVTETEVGADGS